MKRGLQTSAQLWTGSSWKNDLALNMGYFLWNWKDNSEGATKRPGYRVERYRDLFPSLESQSRHCQLMLCYTNFYRPRLLDASCFYLFWMGVSLALMLCLSHHCILWRVFVGQMTCLFGSYVFRSRATTFEELYARNYTRGASPTSEEPHLHLNLM